MPKIKLLLFYLVSLTWGIVMSVVGLFVLLTLALTQSERLLIKVIAGRIVVRTLDLAFGGISLGVVCVVDKDADAHTIKHELGHTRQNMIFGPLFPFVVAIPSAFRYWYRELYLRKNGREAYNQLPKYDDIWFEGQATEFGQKYYINYVEKAIKEGF